MDSIDVTFLAQREQQAADIALKMAAFIDGATVSLDMAVYDFRLSDGLKQIVAAALTRRHAAGVAIRIAYDADKQEPPNIAAGVDPAPGGTGAFVQSLGYPWRRIGGMKLMHNKYIVRDAGGADPRVWTGSTNWTDDAWTKQENNILQLSSPDLAAAYSHDFEQLWTTETIENTGTFDPSAVTLSYGGTPATVQVMFAPGRGIQIDDAVARYVGAARRRVRICSMLLNSSALLHALLDLLRDGTVVVDGIYDKTQMASVLLQWQDVPQNAWKIDAVNRIVAQAGLVGKKSTPYTPRSIHDFLHDKILIVDDTVITGSYNFSRSAEQNAENILTIESPALANAYSSYIDHLKNKYCVDGTAP